MTKSECHQHQPKAGAMAVAVQHGTDSASGAAGLPTPAVILVAPPDRCMIPETAMVTG